VRHLRIKWGTPAGAAARLYPGATGSI